MRKVGRQQSKVGGEEDLPLLALATVKGVAVVAVVAVVAAVEVVEVVALRRRRLSITAVLRTSIRHTQVDLSRQQRTLTFRGSREL